MFRKLSFTLIMIGAAAAAVAQGKIIVDPNITRMPSVTAAEASSAGDVRLAQKITYEGGYKRLHEIVSDLSTPSGVRLYCGQSSKDWQVQDVPVIVYAKDMPLGKLLRAVADGTHTLFISEKVGSEDKEKQPSYRICRNTKSVDSIVSRMEARYYALYAEAEWGWDALAACGKDTSLDLSKTRSQWAPDFAKVLAYLGEDGKRRVLSGERVIVNTETAPEITDALRKLYKRHAPENCLPEDLKKAELRISIDAVGDSDLRYLIGSWTWHTTDSSSSDSGYPIPRCATTLSKVKGFTLPPKPSTKLPKPKEDYPKDRLRLLKTSEDWELPVLNEKITLEAPKNKEHATFCDAVIAIAKASGFNIVCEDFQSQDAELETRSAQFFSEKEITLGEALKKLDCYQPKWLNNETGEYTPTWLINEKDKLIVGWANEWREHHYYLVPESLIAGLREKMNGKGAELDDIVPFAVLTRRQGLEWISCSQDISIAYYAWNYALGTDADRCVWKLYAALDDSDRALAKSEAGLPLGKFDPTWLASFFSQWRTWEISEYTPDEAKETQAQLQLKKQMLSEPKLISTLVMRVGSCGWGKCTMELSSEKDGEKLVLSFHGPNCSLPLYSPERAKELKISRPRAGS